MENNIKTYLFHNIMNRIIFYNKQSELEGGYEISEAERLHDKLPRKIRDFPKTIHYFNFSLRHLNTKI